MNDQYFRDACAMIAALSDEEIEEGLREHGIQFTRRASPAAAVPEGALADFAERLAASQMPLDPEFARIYHENAWDLYATDAAVPVDALPPLTNAEIHTLHRLIECAEKLDERPRPMCRDCADEDGTCPNSGLECDMRALFDAAKALHNKLARAAVEADRAQQGEPVDERDESSVFLATARNGQTCYFGFHSFASAWAGKDGSVKEIKLPVRDFAIVEESGAATKAAAPADAPTMESLVDALRNAALDLLELKGDASAKLEIAGEPPLYVLVGHADGIAKLLPGAAPVPDTGIPAAGERAQFEAWAVDHLGQGYPLTMDEGTYENPVTRWAFKAWIASRRAPVSGTPTSGAVEGAEFLAEVFNRLTQEQKLSVPQGVAGRIGAFMVRNGYRIVFGRWYLQAAPSHPPEAQPCTYPKCNCPMDAPSDPNWCARGLARPSEAKAGKDA